MKLEHDIPMDEKKRQKLAENLAGHKDQETIKEVMRLGEVFLSAQLQSALAADLRAMTLAAILSAIIAGILGGTATIVAAKIDIGWHLLSLLVFSSALLVALWAAIQAARPTRFQFAGNNPAHWEEDGGDKEKLIEAMAEQASFYARGIAINSAAIDENHRCIRKALAWVFGGIAGSMVVEILVILHQIGQLTFSFS
jgi:hypothetical protein